MSTRGSAIIDGITVIATAIRSGFTTTVVITCNYCIACIGCIVIGIVVVVVVVKIGSMWIGNEERV